jgi:hypothetical protein
VVIGGTEKMSKSKNNGVDPQALIDQYGADTARLFIMFASPPDQSLEWSDAGVEGAFRFLKRLWKRLRSRSGRPRRGARAKIRTVAAQADLRRQLHQTIGKVADDYGRRKQFNTAIAAVMELLNAFDKATDDGHRPRAGAGNAGSRRAAALPDRAAHRPGALRRTEAGPGCRHAGLPEADPAALKQDEIELMLQVNGKLRGSHARAGGSRQGEHRSRRAGLEGAVKFMEGNPPKKWSSCPAAWSISSSKRNRHARMPVPVFTRSNFGSPLAAGRLRLPVARTLYGNLPYERSTSRCRLSVIGAGCARYIARRQHAIWMIQKARRRPSSRSDCARKTILSVNAQGRVVNTACNYRYPSAWSTPRGRYWCRPTTSPDRDITYDDSNVLAKDAGRRLLWRDMNNDLVTRSCAGSPSSSRKTPISKKTSNAAQGRTTRGASRTRVAPALRAVWRRAAAGHRSRRRHPRRGAQKGFSEREVLTAFYRISTGTNCCSLPATCRCSAIKN